MSDDQLLSGLVVTQREEAPGVQVCVVARRVGREHLGSVTLRVHRDGHVAHVRSTRHQASLDVTHLRREHGTHAGAVREDEVRDPDMTGQRRGLERAPALVDGREVRQLVEHGRQRPVGLAAAHRGERDAQGQRTVQALWRRAWSAGRGSVLSNAA